MRLLLPTKELATTAITEMARNMEEEEEEATLAMILIMREHGSDIEEIRSRIALITESASMEEAMIEVSTILAAVDAKEKSEEKEDQVGMRETIALTTHEREIESRSI